MKKHTEQLVISLASDMNTDNGDKLTCFSVSSPITVS